MSFTFDPRNILFQICFSFSRAKEACAILLRISDFEQSSETSEACYSVRRLPFTLMSLWVPLALVAISLFFSALISILYLVQFVLRLSPRASSSYSSSARASMSANLRYLMFVTPMLTFPTCSPGASNLIRLRKNVEEDG